MVKLIAKKIGMTQVFGQNGECTPVTVLKMMESVVLRKCTMAKNGYDSYVCAAVPVKVKKKKQSTQDDKEKITYPIRAHMGQFKDGEPLKFIYEMKIDSNMNLKEGTKIDGEILKDLTYVDAQGMSKGKGFQGTIKRFNYKKGWASHGSMLHRGLGGTGVGANNFARLWPGTKRPGRMGHKLSSMQNLKVMQYDSEQHILFLKGAVPGPKHSYLFIKNAIKKSEV